MLAALPCLAGAQPPAVPSAPVPAVVAPAADGPTVLRVGEVMEIALQGNASTGYQWTFEDDAAPVLRRAKPASLAPAVEAGTAAPAPPGPPPKPGSPTTQRWRFEAVEPGDATLRMRYHRPWETTGTVRRAEWKVRVVPADAPAGPGAPAATTP